MHALFANILHRTKAWVDEWPVLAFAIYAWLQQMWQCRSATMLLDSLQHWYCSNAWRGEHSTATHA